MKMRVEVPKSKSLRKAGHITTEPGTTEQGPQGRTQYYLWQASEKPVSQRALAKCHK